MPNNRRPFSKLALPPIPIHNLQTRQHLIPNPIQTSQTDRHKPPGPIVTFPNPSAERSTPAKFAKQVRDLLRAESVFGQVLR
jgi:hypothetical protein